jgi:hypothetical protein
MSNVKIIGLLAVLLCGLVLVSASQAVDALHPSQHAINWSVFGAGGGPMASVSYGLNSTAGQTVIGQSSSTHYALCAGYQCRTDVGYAVYLPVVMRN